MSIIEQEKRFVYGRQPQVKRQNHPEVRCSFWQLSWANGCLYNCDYCWLKAGCHPWSWSDIHIADKLALKWTLRRFCSGHSGSQLLNGGELCDSFVAPEIISFMAETLRHYNEEYSCSHRLLLLTKSADPKVLLENELQDTVIYSVSVNPETVARDLEEGAPLPNKRIHAAMRVKEAGYEVRVRVDPIIAGCEGAYMLEIVKESGLDVPDRGWQMFRLKQAFENARKDRAIAIDEVDSIIFKEKEPLVYYLNRQPKTTLILISNKIEDVTSLPNRALSTLQLKLFRLEPYTLQEAKTILAERVGKALQSDAISDKLLDIIAEVAYKAEDIRLGFSTLLYAGLLAEEAGKTKVDAEDIKSAIQSETRLEHIKGLTDRIKELKDRLKKWSK